MKNSASYGLRLNVRFQSASATNLFQVMDHASDGVSTPAPQ